jgi:hypothetical protein
MLHGSKVNQFACRGIRGKRGFGAVENEIYRRRKLQSLMMANAMLYKLSVSSQEVP